MVREDICILFKAGIELVRDKGVKTKKRGTLAYRYRGVTIS